VTTSTIPDEELLFAVRVVEHRRPVYNLAEVGEVLVGYRSTDYFAKADDLLARGLLSGDVVYRLTEAGRDVVRDYGRAMMALGRPQEALPV
jgi:hypothetical protein